MTSAALLLQSIGQRTFLRCYAVAIEKGDSFDRTDMHSCDPDLEDTSPNALGTRASKLKRIVREGLVAEAVSLCNPTDEALERRGRK